jgi:hypothetical protein
MALDRKEYFEEHLWYEIWMLGETYKLLNLPRVPISEKVIGNALIESFCTHARALIEFFDKRRGADYYTAVPYVRSNKYDKLKRQINNQISHVVDEGRSGEILEKIGSNERKELIDLLGPDIAIFKQTLKPPHDQWRSLPDVPDSCATGVGTVAALASPYGASSSPTFGATVMNFGAPGTTTIGPSIVLVTGPIEPAEKK